MTALRIDEHRPSAIVPEEYEYVGQEYLNPEDQGNCFALEEERKRIQEHMKRTGGTYSRHDHGGNCMVCGNVKAWYTILFYHKRTNTYIRMGQDCAAKCEMGGDFNSSEFRRAIDDARQAYTGKRKAQALLSDYGLSECWDIHHQESTRTPNCDCEQGQWMCDHMMEYARTHKAENTIWSIVCGVVKYGRLSEKQVKYLRSLLAQIAERPARDAKRKAQHDAAAPCPEGRVQVTGVILSTREVESEYQYSRYAPPVTYTKMLVLDDSGFKVWGTRPSSLDHCDKGDRVTFTATVQPSKDDEKFGFYKRPSAAKEVTA